MASSVSYTPVNWQPGPGGGTSISAGNLNIVEDGLEAVISGYNTHIGETDNPHSVDAADIGLSNVLDVPQVEDAGAAASIQATTSGSRPAASGVNERILFQTDTQQIFRSNGTSWVEFAKAPGQIQANDLGFDVATQSELNSHTSSTTNPHSVTAAQVGAVASIDGVSNDGGDIDLIAGANVTITPDDAGNSITISASGGTSGPSSIDGVSNDGGDIDLVSGGAITISPDDANDQITISETHSTTTNNPHSVTAAQVGAIASIDGVSNDGGDVDLISGGAISISADNGANQITISETHSTATNNPHSVTASQVGAPTQTEFDNHANSTSNPHSVTASQVGAMTFTKSDTSVYFANSPTTWTDLDLSGVVGSRRVLALLRVQNDGSNRATIRFRENGTSRPIDDIGTGSSSAQIEPSSGQAFVWVPTDTSGVVEWISDVSRTTAVVVDSYVVTN